MPFFEERTSDIGPRVPGSIPFETPLDPSTSDLLTAAARQENTIVSLSNYMEERAGLVPDPDHNPIDLIGGTRYEANYLDRFVDSVSEADTRARMSRIDREEGDRRILDAGGIGGLAAAVGMGVLDPTLFIPLGTIYRGVKVGRAAFKSSLMTGAATGAMVAGQEAILYGTQETRTGLESTANIATGTIVGGLLGGAISLMTAKEIAKLNQVMEGFRKEVNADLAGTGPADAGAAAATREGLTLAPALGLERAAARLSPVTTLQTSPFDASRAVIRDMADAGLSYRENFKGVPTSEGGTVETRVKMRRGPLISAIEVMDDAYARYVMSKPAVGFLDRRAATMRSGWAFVRGEEGGKLTARQFRDEIGKAMRRGDEHPIPEVAEAAKAFRAKVFDPLLKEAQKLKLLPEDVDVLGAESYLTRVYNREKIIAQRDRWTKVLMDNFTRKHEAAVSKFQEKQTAKVARLEDEAADLSLSPEARSVLIAQLPKDLETLKAGSPRFVSIDEDLKLLRSREAKARKAGEAEKAKAIRQEIKEALADAGDDYARYVTARNAIGARLRRVKSDASREPKVLAEKAEALRARIANISSDRGNDLASLMPEELPGLVDEVTNTILHEAVLRLPGISVLQGPRGPLKRRVLDIRDEAIEDFLESDIEKVARVYTSSMASDIELTAKFGDVNMTEQLRRLTDEFNAKVAKTTPGDKGNKARKKLSRQFERDQRTILALRDRIRGNYMAPDNPDGLAYRAAKTALSLNYLARLGGVTISSLPDAARPIMRYGLNAFRDAWIPLITELPRIKLAAAELRLAGTALDIVRDMRAMELADIFEDFGRNHPIERLVQYSADKFSSFNMMKYWNGGMKSIAGVAAMAHILRAAKAVATGKATASQIDKLAQGGIDAAMAKRIWAHVEKSGDAQGRVILPNTEEWRLANGAADIKAIEAFRALLNREVETLIVTPGLEKPLFMSKTWGKLMGQFKTFPLVSTQRTTLAGLQQRDAAALTGVMFSMALGAVAAKIKAELAGRDTSKWSEAQWAAEALDNSGIMGVLMEANAMAEKVTRGRLGLSVITGKTVSRYQSRNAMGALLGPTADFARDITTLGSLGADDWSRSDTRALRKIVPMQNLFWLRKLFDQVEENVNDYYRIPRQRRN